MGSILLIDAGGVQQLRQLEQRPNWRARESRFLIPSQSRREGLDLLATESAQGVRPSDGPRAGTLVTGAAASVAHTGEVAFIAKRRIASRARIPLSPSQRSRHGQLIEPFGEAAQDSGDERRSMISARVSATSIILVQCSPPPADWQVLRFWGHEPPAEVLDEIERVLQDLRDPRTADV